YSHAEVAAIVRKSEPACRQVLKRARDRVSDSRRRFLPSADEQRRLAEQFFRAAQTGDVDTLVSLLAEDAVAYGDGGGKVASAMNPILGADRIARFLAGIPKKDAAVRLEFAELN